MEFINKKEVRVVGKNSDEIVPKNESVDENDESFIPCGECTTVEEVDKPPVERILLPADVTSFAPEDESIFIVGTREGKVTKIGGIDHMTNLKSLVLRSCLISAMEGLGPLSKLEKLELYDNQVEEMSCYSTLSNLKILDLSFNAIRVIQPLAEFCPLLEHVYIAQNKLRKIAGLAGLIHLKTLDLGANRIRDIEGLETLTSLESLWLGKNKIESIQGLETLTKLRQLDIQSNRLTTIGDGLSTLSHLEELYLASNAITSVEDEYFKVVPSTAIGTIDLSRNNISSLKGIERYPTLQELWMSTNTIASFDDLSVLTSLPGLTCLYLEHNPIAKDFEYRKKLAEMVPTLEQLDATMINRTIH